MSRHAWQNEHVALQPRGPMAGSPTPNGADGRPHSEALQSAPPAASSFSAIGPPGAEYMETKMRRTAAMMIRTSFAIAAVVAGLVLASLPASAQDYLVDGRAASAAETRYLTSQGMAPGNWRINGWGIGPADSSSRKIASADASTGGCWYVLDVPLGDCGAAGKAIAARAPVSGSSPQSRPQVQLAAVETGGN